MTEAEWIDKVLADTQGKRVVYLPGYSKEYDAAVVKTAEYRLITDTTYFQLTKQGRKAIEAGGFEKWLSIEQQRKAKYEKRDFLLVCLIVILFVVAKLLKWL